MKKRHLLRRYFVAGLVVILPVGATFFVLSWLFRTLDAILGRPLQRVIPMTIPGLGLILLIVVVLLVGWLAYRTVGRQIIRAWDALLSRFPLTARIYNATSQIVQAVLARQQPVVRRVVLVPFPTDGSWAIGFVTSEESQTAAAVLGERHVHVFLPTTPNPTSGFMLMVRHDRVREVGLTVEEAMKVVISGGAVDLPHGAGVARGVNVDAFLGERDDGPA